MEKAVAVARRRARRSRGRSGRGRLGGRVSHPAKGERWDGGGEDKSKQSYEYWAHPISILTGLEKARQFLAAG